MKWASEAAATAVEYAIMVSLIAVVVITGAIAVGQATNDQLECSGESLQINDDAC